MKLTQQQKVRKFIKAVSNGIGDRSGCNDNDVKLARQWVRKFYTITNKKEFEKFLEDVSDQVAY